MLPKRNIRRVTAEPSPLSQTPRKQPVAFLADKNAARWTAACFNPYRVGSVHVFHSVLCLVGSNLRWVITILLLSIAALWLVDRAVPGSRPERVLRRLDRSIENWRYTDIGWRHVSELHERPPERAERIVATHLHPLLVSLLLLLPSLAALLAFTPDHKYAANGPPRAAKASTRLLTSGSSSSGGA